MRRSDIPISLAEAEKHVVQADVEIGVTLDGSTQNVTWAFKNWTGGSGSIDYPDLTMPERTELLRTDPNIQGFEASEGNHFLAYRFQEDTISSLDDLPWASGHVGIQFYGPGRQEAGGYFSFSHYYVRDGNAYNESGVRGFFAARKQAE